VTKGIIDRNENGYYAIDDQMANKEIMARKNLECSKVSTPFIKQGRFFSLL
jgi:hypothetical protein